MHPGGECRSRIVADGDVLDAGMVFGTGFPPFRGGPVYYLESLSGAQVIGEIPSAAEEQSHHE